MSLRTFVNGEEIPEPPAAVTTIADARDLYANLAASLFGESDDRYVRALFRAWDEHMAEMPQDQVVPWWREYLGAIIADPDLRREARVEWLDAYPSAICEPEP